MKFALNHSWRFDSVALAWMAGLCQVVITISIELLLYLLVILSHDLIDVITTFMALFVISKLDEVFFVEFADSELTRQIIKDAKFASLRTIQTTTSHLGNHGKADHKVFFTDDIKAANWS